MMDGAALIGAAPIAGPVQAAGVPAGPPVLLERDAALGAVCDALQAAGGGEGGALLVIGAAGIGKSSVVSMACALAQEAGFRVAVGVGTPMEAGLAYGLIGQAVVALGGHAVDELDRIASPWDRSGRLYRIFRLIARQARAPLQQALGLAERACAERVAQLAAQGMSNAQIAAALIVSPDTIDNHLQQVYAKLGIHSRRELIRRSVSFRAPVTPHPPVLPPRLKIGRFPHAMGRAHG
jgi:DNA-binding CsgD family transcriptional regulator